MVQLKANIILSYILNQKLNLYDKATEKYKYKFMDYCHNHIEGKNEKINSDAINPYRSLENPKCFRQFDPHSLTSLTVLGATTI